MPETGQKEQFTVIGNGKWKHLFCRHCAGTEPLPIKCDVATLLQIRRGHQCKPDDA